LNQKSQQVIRSIKRLGW